MPITLKCSGCSRKITAPDSAAGKRVKCPKCGTVVALRPPASRSAPSPAVPKPQAASPARPLARPPAAMAPRAASVSAPSETLFAPDFGGSHAFDDMLTGSDLGLAATGFGGQAGSPSVEIPQAEKKKKRNKAFYWAPGAAAIGAASLNILVLLGCLGFIIWAMIALVQAEVEGAGFLLYPIIRLCIFAFFVGGGNVHAIVAGLNLVTMRGRTASAVAIGELLFTPLAFALFFGFMLGWVAGAIFGVGALIYNGPIAGWVALAIAGKQAKIDFDEYEGNELDNLAEELQKRAVSKNMH